MGDLDGKTVLVTGGSRGIGAAIVRVLGAAGADVLLHCGENRERAEQVAAELGSERCHVVQADFADETSLAGLWRDAVAWKGRVDVLVNNAGIFEEAPVEADFETWSRAWRRTLDINLVACAHLCRESILHFREKGGGIIVNISSRAAFRGDTPDYMHYAASKGAMVALTRSIARGFGREGILAYGIAPGFVRTEMAEEFTKIHGEEVVTREIPLGDMATPEEVAELTAFLATGKAPSATGTTIDVNGASYVR
jgi:3-oxoacyl-[acyl-carrier protein] reductase